MPSCEAIGEQIFAYLDGELRGNQLDEFELHLKSCPGCQSAVVNRRAFLETVQSAGPLYRAPDALRSRIDGIFRDHAKRSFSQWLQAFLARALAAPPRSRWGRPQLAFALLLVMAIVGGTWIARSTGQPPRSPFAAAALRAHQQRVLGALPLGLHSASPEAVSNWFVGKVPFSVSLPTAEGLPSEQQPYQIEGARLVSYGNGQLGYIAYRVGNTPVSLLVAPASEVRLAGQRRVRMKSLLFHYDSGSGFHIVTWAVPKKGVAYALVSDASQHANQSCIVCHAGPKDRDFMRSLVTQ